MSEGTIWTLTLAEFRDRAASDSPTPGGGSVSAVAASLGLSLVIMALRITGRRKGRAEVMAPLIVAGERLLQELAVHAEADIAVFGDYMTAHRLPRGTEAEKKVRQRALDAALAAATEVPLNAAGTIVESLALARRAAENAAPDIMSDAAAGGALLHGALAAVLSSVDVNLRLLPATPDTAAYATSRRHLQQTGDTAHGEIQAIVARRVARA